MRQRHFTRPRDHAPTKQPGVGNCVVRRTKGPDTKQTGTRIERARHAVDLGSLEGHLESKGWEDDRHALGQHRFA